MNNQLKKKKILVIFGTRPEAIKMAPIIQKLQLEKEHFDTKVCVTGQHREMLDQVLKIFSIKPDYDLNLMKANQSLSYITGEILKGLHEIFYQECPDLILIQGDTTTTLGASLAAFYQKIKIGHIEAGLRTGDKHSPWPEEVNRRITSVLAELHFAPTEWSEKNLIEEKHDPEKIFITGNTVIDALFEIVHTLENNVQYRKDMESQFGFLLPDKKIILTTGHRRENFGDGFKNICHALEEIVKQNQDVQLVYPVHLNPNVRKPVQDILGKNSDYQNRIHLIEPLDYLPFVYLMNQSYIILTDSGGIQEEAPSLGKPVLVLRNTTERPEGILAGTIKLVGTSSEKIINETNRLLTDINYYDSMSKAHNPYGDGKAAIRIIDIIKQQLGVHTLIPELENKFRYRLQAS